jgi:hypothetical protein
MPLYDRRCNKCGEEVRDVWEGVNWLAPSCAVEDCEGQLERVWLSKPPGVVSDECDVWVRNGICNEDGSPRHYRFKSEMKAEAKRRGMENHVVHQGGKGSDKSPHTSRWI